ncbi:MAG: hypothetical protein GY755_24740 [Chloroflexi bacterium]|nr:hypothetical protein [Chloroflexota bacterium]
MPISIDPPPKDDEIECARCGSYFYYDLTRCPECGVNIYEPDEEREYDHKAFRDISRQSNGVLSKIRDFFRRVFDKPYTAEEIFGNALEQASLYDDLLRKVGGDEFVVENLIEHEREKLPKGIRTTWLKNAIQSWERDNRVSGKTAR